MRPAGIVEMNQRGQRALRSDLENRTVTAVAAIGSRAVEIAVVAQRQAIGWTRPAVEVEVNERGQGAVGRYAKHRPLVSAASLDGRAVKIAVLAQRQACRARPAAAGQGG